MAAKAKVSIGTVDRVLHNRGEVAEVTRKKILSIIDELNYQPNILASTLASKKSALFATLLPEPPSEEGYWNKPVIGVNKRIAELPQYGLQVQSFTFKQNESKSFSAECQKILELQPDGVVLAPFFKKEALLFIDQLKELNIPFVFIDSEIKDAGHLSYIGQDSYQSGLVSGKLLDMILPDGNILVVHFAKEMDNQNHLIQREKAFYDWFLKMRVTPHTLFTTDVPDTDDPTWMKKIEEIIDTKNIKGIFVTNSKVFNIGNLLEQSGRKGIMVIGHDLVKENVEFLKKDLVQFLICQRPEEQGYNAINVLFRSVVQKREIEMENYTSIDIITKENVDYYKEFK
ncbi:substrate-binding domain-containing protein [Maribellus sediminis]|uniref:substrate-binding domain-containing protein n=1 Tax=Maribellus sediminis TaxID=2696285 RepID=UPI0023F87D9C|nr:substrate-binding domain-containing protein [Maribellus sediminis]